MSSIPHIPPLGETLDDEEQFSRRLKPAVDAPTRSLVEQYPHAFPAADPDPDRDPDPQPVYQTTSTPPGPLPPPDKPKRKRRARAAPKGGGADDDGAAKGRPDDDDDDREPLMEWPLAKSCAAKIGTNLRFDIEGRRWFEFVADEGWLERTRESILVRVRDFVHFANPYPTKSGAMRAYASKAVGDHICDLLAQHQHIRASQTFDLDDLLIGLPGGRVYDIRTGRARRARLTDYVTRWVGFAPAAGPTPQWDAFMLRTFGGDCETINYLESYFGYGLQGSCAEPDPKWIYLQGAARTGKSTIVKVVSAVYGLLEDLIPSKAVIVSGHEEHKAVLTTLEGIRMATVSEVPAHGRFDAPLLCSVISGEKIRARHMGCGWYKFRSHAKGIIAGNERLSTSSAESGLRRRLNIVVCKNQLSKNDADPGLADRIVEDEGPAILHKWLLAARAWQLKRTETRRSGLRPESKFIVDETERYFREVDNWVGDFIAACLEFGPDYSVSRADVFAAYKRWAVREGIERPKVAKTVTANLRARLLPRGVDEVKMRGDRGFAGVRVSDAYSDGDGPIPY